MLLLLLCICSRGVLGSPEDLMVWSHFIFPNFSFTLIFISIDPWEIVAVLITWTLKKNPITSRLHISYWLVVFSWLNYAFLIQVLYFSTVTHGRVIPWCRPNAFMGPCLGIEGTALNFRLRVWKTSKMLNKRFCYNFLHHLSEGERNLIVKLVKEMETLKVVGLSKVTKRLTVALAE